jgi:dihydroorotase
LLGRTDEAFEHLSAAIDAGVLDLMTVARALTVGPARVLDPGSDSGSIRSWLEVGAPADLVVVDRAARWQVEPSALRTLGHNTPLMGRELPGLVLMTVAGGRWAWSEGDETR